MAFNERAVTARVSGCKVDTYYGDYQTVAATVSNSWQAWKKPRNATMVMIWCLGAGAGGAGGDTAVIGNARAGGGGGGSGALCKLTIPAMFLPDTLFLLPGRGGVGGAAATSGVNGGNSFVADKPASTATIQDLILMSGNTVAQAGTNSAGGGGGGSGGAAALATSVLYAGFGDWTVIAGAAGTAKGAAGAPGVAVTWGGVGLPVSGGAGGGSSAAGGAGQLGGAITGAGLMPTLLGGAIATDGSTGLYLQEPARWSGGSGGGAGGQGVGAQIGGRGGNGAYGCGGGGGGGGTTGGAGGWGGPGIIMIVSW